MDAEAGAGQEAQGEAQPAEAQGSQRTEGAEPAAGTHAPPAEAGPGGRYDGLWSPDAPADSVDLFHAFPALPFIGPPSPGVLPSP